MTVIILLFLSVVAPLFAAPSSSSAASLSSASSQQQRGVGHRRLLSAAVFAVADREDTVTSSSSSLPDNEGRELWHVWHPVWTSYYGGSKAGKASSKGSKSTVSLGTTTVYVVKQSDDNTANHVSDNSSNESDTDNEDSNDDEEDDEEDNNDEDSYNSNDTNDNGDSVSKDDADENDENDSSQDDDASDDAHEKNKPTMMPATDDEDEPTDDEDVPTNSPTMDPTIRQDDETDDMTNTPTILSTTTTTMPTIAPSSSTDDDSDSPTISSSPTTSLITPPVRSNLTMQLFKLNSSSTSTSSSSSNSNPLSDIQVVYYNERTARYIESFYNDNANTNDDNANDDDDGTSRRSDNIANAIVGVKAIVEITNQTAITTETKTGSSNSDTNRYSQSSVGVEGGIVRGANKTAAATIVRYRKHQQYNGIVQQSQYNQQRRRQLQDEDEEEEDKDDEEEENEEEEYQEQEDENCSGNESVITFTITLEYRTFGVVGAMDEFTLDEIIAEPFSTPNYREQYINYLNGDDMDFEELTCTLGIDFPPDDDDDEGDGVTKSPTVMTGETAAPSTTSPTTGTSPPTPVVVDTLAPVSIDTLSPSIQPSVSSKPTPVLSLMVTIPPSTSPPVSGSVITTLSLPPVITTLTLPPFSSSNIVNEVVSGFEGLVDNASLSIMDNIPPVGGDGDGGGTSPPVSTPSQVMTVIEGSTSSSSPAISTDDIFDNIPRSRIAPSNATSVRQCTDIIQTLSSRGKPIDEFEVSFVYGVETLTEEGTYIGNLESLILDLVAKSVLRCSNKEQVVVSSVEAVQQLRSAGVGEGGEFMEYIGVVKIRYPRRGEVTTICKSILIVCFI